MIKTAQQYYEEIVEDNDQLPKGELIRLYRELSVMLDEAATSIEEIEEEEEE